MYDDLTCAGRIRRDHVIGRKWLVSFLSVRSLRCASRRRTGFVFRPKVIRLPDFALTRQLDVMKEIRRGTALPEPLNNCLT